MLEKNQALTTLDLHDIDIGADGKQALKMLERRHGGSAAGSSNFSSTWLHLDVKPFWTVVNESTLCGVHDTRTALER